jgi:hypothetical protein
LTRTLLALLLVGCPQAEAPLPRPQPTTPTDCADAPDWDFAEGYIRNWCAPCHSAAVVGAARQGAPAELNYDTWNEIALSADRIRARATGDAPDMPPVSAWLDCGAEGSDPTPGPCELLTWTDATTVSSPQDAEALCLEGNAVRGDLVVGDVSLDCLCEVDGSLTVEDGSLPLLTRVTGDLNARSGAPQMPSLHTIDGALLLEASQATGLTLPALSTVGGDVAVHATPVLTSLGLPALLTVGGDLSIGEAPLVQVDLARLRTVEGSFTLDDLPQLTELVGLGAVEHVGGELRLAGTGLQALDAFRLLNSCGPILLTSNPELVTIDGFTSLPDASTVQVTDNATLYELDGFDNVVEVEALEVIGNARLQRVFGFVNLAQASDIIVADNPALNSLIGLSALTDVGTLTIAAAPLQDLPWFRIQNVTERLEIAQLPSLTRITGFATLTSIAALTIRDCPLLERIEGPGTLATTGPLELRSLPRLEGIPLLSGVQTTDGLGLFGTGLPSPSMFVALQEVRGDVSVIGNSAFSDLEATTFVQGLQVDGAVEVRDNGP